MMKRKHFTLAEFNKIMAQAARAEWREKVEKSPQAAWQEYAARCAQDANMNMFKSWRGTYVISDVPTASGQVICLYNNYPYRHAPDLRDKETELFRLRMTAAGISELGYATYSPPGQKWAGYTYAMILDARDSQTGIIHNAMKDAMREAWEWNESFGDEDSEEQDEQDAGEADGADGAEAVNDEIAEAVTVNVGEMSQLRQVRVGQDAFSRAVRENYGHRCCFPGCDVDHDALLIGAHIARWADDSECRGDVSNGLCLCALHDKAFESGFFTLTDDLFVKIERRKAPSSSWVESHLQKADGLQIKLGRIRPSVLAIRRHRESHA